MSVATQDLNNVEIPKTSQDNHENLTPPDIHYVNGSVITTP